MHAQAEVAVLAPPEDEGRVDHDLLAIRAGDGAVAHRDGEIPVDLDAILSRIVVVTGLRPALEREPRVLGERRIAAAARRSALRDGVIDRSAAPTPQPCERSAAA